MMTHKKKLFVYKILILALVLVFVFFGRLYNRVPKIEMRAVVTVLGVDVLDDESVKVTAHVLVPLSASGSQSVQTLVSNEGDNFNVALDGLSVSNGAKVELAQCGMLVFGKTACEKGILPFVKAIISLGDINAGAIMVTSEKMEAEEYLKAFMETVDASSEVVSSIIAYFQSSFYMPGNSCFKFLSGSIGESESSFVPCLELKAAEKGAETGGDEGGESEGGGSGGGGGEYTTLESMTNAAVFLRGLRVGVLDETQTRGLIWTQKGANRGYIKTENFIIGGVDYGELTGSIKNASSKTQVSFKDGKPHVKFFVKTDIDIMERYRFTEDLDMGKITAHELYNGLDKLVAETIQDEIFSAVDASIALKCDFMNLKYRFFRLESKRMKEYMRENGERFFDDLSVEVEVRGKAK